MGEMIMDELRDLIPLLLPVLLIQLSLQVYSVINLVRRGKVRFNSKFLWGVIILAGGLLGSIAYLSFRGDEE
jgi:uncharacterized membrane protein YfcA